MSLRKCTLPAMPLFGMKEHEVLVTPKLRLKPIDVLYHSPPSLPYVGILHNHYHGHTVKEGDMLLVDAGVYYGYAGDMSSTYSVPARNSLPYKKKSTIYRLFAFSCCKRIMEFRSKNTHGFLPGYLRRTTKTTKKGMYQAGSLGFPMPCSSPCWLGHMMGLDVHDMEKSGWEQSVGYSLKARSSDELLRLGLPLILY